MTEVKILTPTGFQRFYGIQKYIHDEYIKLTFVDNLELSTAVLHRFIVNGKEIFTKDLKIGDNIGKEIKNIEIIKEQKEFFDPLNVDNGSIFCHDKSFISHNSFLGAQGTLISLEAITNLVMERPIHILDDNCLKIYSQPEEGHSYITCVDVSRGLGQDYSTFNIIDISTNPYRQVATYRNNKISPLMFPTKIAKWAGIYNQSLVLVEANDRGSLVTSGLIYDLEYENVFVESHSNKNQLGVDMDKKVKSVGCSNFKDLVEQKKLLLVDEETIFEITTFVEDKNTFKASHNNHDDLVMNFVLFSWFISTDFFTQFSEDAKRLYEYLYIESKIAEEYSVPPFGIIDDGVNSGFLFSDHGLETEFEKIYRIRFDVEKESDSFFRENFIMLDSRINTDLF